MHADGTWWSLGHAAGGGHDRQLWHIIQWVHMASWVTPGAVVGLTQGHSQDWCEMSGGLALLHQYQKSPVNMSRQVDMSCIPGAHVKVRQVAAVFPGVTGLMKLTMTGLVSSL